jgi:hypothetical protein
MVMQGARARLLTWATAFLAIAWSQAASAVPVLYVSVDGAPEVSFEYDQVCDGTAPVTCLGTGATGDLLISSWELTADPSAYLTGAFNFYNGSVNTISVVATVLFPMGGSFATPDVALGTGIVNNVFGGGIFDVTVEGLVDPPAAPLAIIDEVSPGVPFTVCEVPSFDPECQGATSVSLTTATGTLSVLSAIALRLSFSLTADTVATIGLQPGEDYDGAAYFALTPQSAVPVPAAAWLLVSGLAALGLLRRAAGRD